MQPIIHSGKKEAGICSMIINRVRNIEFYFKTTRDIEIKYGIMCLALDYGRSLLFPIIFQTISSASATLGFECCYFLSFQAPIFLFLGAPFFFFDSFSVVSCRQNQMRA